MTNESGLPSLSAMEILEGLGICWQSGSIEIVGESDAYELHLHRGHMIFATSSHRSMRLGHLLLQRGSIQPAYLDDVLRGRRSIFPDKALGSVLVRDGAISVADLAAGVEEQAIQVLTRVIALENATFIHHQDEQLPQGIEVIPMNAGRLLDIARQRHHDLVSAHIMQRILPAHDAQLSLSVQLALISHLLTDAELLVALNLDRGVKNMDDLESGLPLDPLTLKRSVISLLEREFVSTNAGRFPPGL